MPVNPVSRAHELGNATSQYGGSTRFHSIIPRRHVESQGICYFSHGGLPEASILRHPVLVLRAAASSHGGCELEQPGLTQTNACLSSCTFLHPNLLAATSQHGGLSFLVFLSTCTSLHHACVWWTCADRHLGTTLGRVAYIHAIGMAGHGHVFYGSPQVVLRLGYFSNGSSLTVLRHDWTYRQTTVWLRPSPTSSLGLVLRS